MLSRRCGATWATVAAFIAAIPTYVYFSYAPFLSNDIAPGALLLAMVITCEDFLEPRGAPRARTFLTLVGLGATAALIKPSLGVFWLSILCAAGATALSLPSAERRPRLARVTMLLAGASLSGALYWIVCGVALPAELGHTFWIRPFHQLQTLAGSISAEQPPAWLYLRNLPAYGVAAGLGIIPGLVLSWRAGSLGRLAALTWLGCLVVMQLYVQREVRYLAFLAPTTALLLVPAFEWLARRRGGALTGAAIVLVPFLPIFPLSPLDAAAQIATPSHRINKLATLVEPLGFGAARQRPLALVGGGLTATPDQGTSPLVGDPYHRIFHFGQPHLALLGYEPADLYTLRPEALPHLAASDFAGAVLWSNRGGLRNPYRWSAGPPIGRETLQQACGRLDETVFQPNARGRYESPDAAELLLRDVPPAHAPGLLLKPSPELLSTLSGLSAPALHYVLEDAEGSPATPRETRRRASPIVTRAGVGWIAPGAALSTLAPDAAIRLRGIRWQRTDPAAR
jgi:hypothetical protein